MNFLNRTHVVVDLETLDVSATAVILSLGAVSFRFEDNDKRYEDFKKDGFFVKLSVENQVKTYKKTISKSTIEFWKKQTEDAQKNNFVPSKNDETLADGMTLFNQYLAKSGYEWGKSFIFSRGNAFDFGKLEYVYEVNLKTITPFNKFMERDVRTMIDFYAGSCTGKYALSYPVSEVKHNPLSDAAMDAARMVDLFTKVTT